MLLTDFVKPWVSRLAVYLRACSADLRLVPLYRPQQKWMTSVPCTRDVLQEKIPVAFGDSPKSLIFVDGSLSYGTYGIISYTGVFLSPGGSSRTLNTWSRVFSFVLATRLAWLPAVLIAPSSSNDERSGAPITALVRAVYLLLQEKDVVHFWRGWGRGKAMPLLGGQGACHPGILK